MYKVNKEDYSMNDITKIKVDGELESTYKLFSKNREFEKRAGGNTGSQSSVQPDWNQNDKTAPDYVKNRPFYTGDPVETEIVNVSLSNFRQSGNLYAYQGTDFSGEPFEIGQTYQVTLDDSTYNCTAWLFDELNCLGNSSILGHTIEGSADVPFIISRNTEMSMVYTTIEGASHSLKIAGKVFEVKEIDKKYIPALDYLDENNPTGTGTFSLNRKVNSDIGGYSVALGENCVASGDSSISVGSSTKATGLTAQAFGFYTEANARFSHAEGSNSKVSTNASEKVVVLDAESAAGTYGHAEGFSTLVTGSVGAHAEGAMALASGDSSHAEGYKTTASGVNSHAEGNETTASGVNSHAEGNNTTAYGNNSHAEGYHTTAYGNNSHAEGSSTYLFSDVFTSDNPTNDEIKNRWDSLGAASFSLAKGIGSHVEGSDNLAFGDRSHAEGSNVVAYGMDQHVQGRCNIEDSSGTYAHIVGNGTMPSQRSNAHTLDWSGNAWYAGTVEGKALILPSSTSGSSKKFKITVDDSGALTATEVT